MIEHLHSLYISVAKTLAKNAECLDHFIVERRMVSLLAQMTDVALDVVSLDLMRTDGVGLDSGRRSALSAALGAAFSSPAPGTALSRTALGTALASTALGTALACTALGTAA